MSGLGPPVAVMSPVSATTVYMIKCVVNNVSRRDRLFVGGLYTYLCGILFYLDRLSDESWYLNIHIPFQIPKQIIEIL